MADITIPPNVKTDDKQLMSFVDSCIRAIRQLKIEVERLEKVKQNA